MIDWYDEHILGSGRSPALWLLIGFVVAYVVTRTITRRIRAKQARGTDGDAGVNDVFIGGVHIHHQVWGILLVLVSGLLELRFRPDSPWAEVLAALFGVGAALALDEFALWLHLEDVYWSEEGRKSIDAVMVACVVGLVLLVGTSPVGVGSEDINEVGGVIAALVIIIHIGFTVVCLVKGKISLGLIGLPVPLVSVIGAIRLAKPTSFWARRYYREPKLAAASRRFGADYRANHEALRDLFSGGGARGPMQR